MTNTLRRSAAVLAVSGFVLATGCSRDASDPQASAGSASGAGVVVDITAGGPYTVTVGTPITLTGSYAVSGQAGLNDGLTAIGKAIRQYVAVNGSYPPGALTDASGKPLLSWRVLLLPYLGKADLYARFDLTKPWDDPANKALLAQIPSAYQRPGSAVGSTDTGIVGAAGPGAVLGRNGATLGAGVKPREVTHGTTATLAAGPAGPGVTIPWTAPGDVDTSSRSTLGVADGLAGPSEGITPLLYLDGSVYPMPNSLAATYVQGWSRIAATGCSPPRSLSLTLVPAWDLKGDGSFAAAGSVVSYRPATAGTFSVPFRVVDAYGGVHLATATVTAR